MNVTRLNCKWQFSQCLEDIFLRLGVSIFLRKNYDDLGWTNDEDNNLELQGKVGGQLPRLFGVCKNGEININFHRSKLLRKICGGN